MQQNVNRIDHLFNFERIVDEDNELCVSLSLHFMSLFFCADKHNLFLHDFSLLGQNSKN